MKRCQKDRYTQSLYRPNVSFTSQKAIINIDKLKIIIMEINAYKKATFYEVLIRKSLNNPDAMRNQKAIFNYRALYFSIDDGKDVKAQKQLFELKLYLAKALKKVSSMRLYRSKKEMLLDLIPEIDDIMYLEQIDSIVDRSLDLLSEAVE